MIKKILTGVKNVLRLAAVRCCDWLRDQNEIWLERLYEIKGDGNCSAVIFDQGLEDCDYTCPIGKMECGEHLCCYYPSFIKNKMVDKYYEEMGKHFEEEYNKLHKIDEQNTNHGT